MFFAFLSVFFIVIFKITTEVINKIGAVFVKIIFKNGVKITLMFFILNENIGKLCEKSHDCMYVLDG